MIHAALYTAHTPTRGWGVFSHEDIEADTLIEISPVVVMTQDEKKLLDQTTLYNYIFDWQGDACCMALGLIPVYNHACPSNCEYFQDYEEGIIYIKTVKTIQAGDELFINYNGDFDNEKPVWFPVSE
ncbi:MAG: hypothetical protein RIQ62_925 [Bacteroidota bacterium]|jgi:SET domain-containing protein